MSQEATLCGCIHTDLIPRWWPLIDDGTKERREMAARSLKVQTDADHHLEREKLFFIFYNNKPSEVWSDKGGNNKTIWGFNGAFSTVKRSLSDRGITKVNSVRSSPLSLHKTHFIISRIWFIATHQSFQYHTQEYPRLFYPWAATSVHPEVLTMGQSLGINR